MSEGLLTVEGLLLEKEIYYIEKGHDCIITCIGPDHDDKNPSLRIDKVSGIFHCFSCGFKGNIFDYFNAKPNKLAQKVQYLRKKIRDIQISTRGLEFPEDAHPFLREYRGISKDTFKLFSAFEQEQEWEGRIVFPLKDISGRIYAFIARHKNSNSKDKYMVSPHGSSLHLYPAKVTPIHNSIILVEGIFDMLNLYDKGLTNVVCMFGVSTISEKNVVDKLRSYKLQGIDHIYLMLDSDEAGKNSAKKLKKLLNIKTSFTVEILDFLEAGTDPGDLTAEDVKSTYNYIYKENI